MVSMDLIIQGGALPTFLLDRCVTATGCAKVLPQPPQTVRLTNVTRTPEFDKSIAPILAQEKLDWCFAESGKRLADFHLIAFDMDSTLITIECIDEIADFAGKKAEIAAVTEAAMRGELDFCASLRKRLNLLAGLDVKVLDRVYSERLQLSPGVHELLAAAKRHGIRTAILSGGFSYFTQRLQNELGFNFTASNELEIVDEKLTGNVVGDIVDAEAKASHLRRLQQELGITKDQVIAIGDGANDLLMMAEAGLSVAFRAKPATRAKARMALNFAGLDGLLNVYPT